MTGALPSDTVKNRKLNVNSTAIVSSARSYPMEDPQSSSNPFNSVNAIKTCFKSTNDFQKDQPQIKILTVDEIETPKSKDEKDLEDEFKDLHLNLPVLEVLAHAPMVLCEFNPIISLQNAKNGLLEETDDVLGLADGTKMYPVGIVRNVEVYVGKLKLLENFYVINMEKDPTCPLLIGRGFLATASAVIDCKKAKIAVGDGITRSIFRVKDINLGRKAHLVEDKQIQSVGVFDELEEKHVTWARFEKKLDKNTTFQAWDFHFDAFTKSAQKDFKGGGVTAFCDGVAIADKKNPLEDSTG
ncbi:MAK10-like protein [Tanacetum coccineum]